MKNDGRITDHDIFSDISKTIHGALSRIRNENHMNTGLAQNRVSAATAKLPEEVKRLGVTTEKSLPTMTLLITLSSDGRYDQKFLGKWQVKLDAEYLCDMSGVSQHGDFALNNLGWTRTGLHVFDWEEFSNTNIPGFDLTTFLISIVDFDPIRITGILEKTSDEAGRFARDACDAIGLHWSQYKALFPIHLVTLQVLRRRYCLAKVHVDRLVRGLRELA